MIKILPAFGDNYIYLLTYADNRCLVIDPGEASVVLHELKRAGLELTHILLTHHHADHIGGLKQLKQKTGTIAIGPDPQRIAGLDTALQDEQSFAIDNLTIGPIATPGHTATSVCYYVTGSTLNTPLVFTGDTLFVCGCGRMFECDGQTMHRSLMKLTELPEDTLVYPGHDYTAENIEFALTLNPDRTDLRQKQNEIQNLAAAGKPTVPSTLAQEKQLNPFLCDDWQTFAKRRKQKDIF